MNNKNLIISIRPEWVAKILNGEKTIEIRKSMPKCELPCEVYIYCTKRLPPMKDYYDYEERIKWQESGLLGKVVAKFTLNERKKIYFSRKMTCDLIPILKKACITLEELDNYSLHFKKDIAIWEIDNLEVFDKPKDLAEFGMERGPQSWCYIKEDNSCSHLE